MSPTNCTAMSWVHLNAGCFSWAAQNNPPASRLLCQLSQPAICLRHNSLEIMRNTLEKLPLYVLLDCCNLSDQLLLVSEMTKSCPQERRLRGLMLKIFFFQRYIMSFIRYWEIELLLESNWSRTWAGRSIVPPWPTPPVWLQPDTAGWLVWSRPIIESNKINLEQPALDLHPINSKLWEAGEVVGSHIDLRLM